MRTFLILIGLLSFNMGVNAQENSLKFHSASTGVGIFGMSPYNGSAPGGFSLHADLVFRSNNNLFAVGANLGQEIIFPVAEFQDFNISYGKELRLNRVMILEVFGGLGYVRGTYLGASRKIEKTTIGVPITTKLNFFMGNHFAIGIRPYVNINSFSAIYSGTLSFGYKF